ncbi:MAG: MMPL family transporter, partial [Thermomicrobiales bacterium]
PSGSLLARWARFVVRHHWAVIVASLLVVIVAGGAWRANHGDFVNNRSIPGAESQRAVDLLHARFPNRAGDNAMIVIRADAGLTDAAVRSDVDQMVADASQIPGVSTVISPYGTGAGAIAQDGKTGFVLVQFTQQADAVPSASVDALYQLRDAHNRDGLQVELGGQVISAAERTPPGTSELIGIGAAMLILLVAFGSVVAMGLPLATAATGLLTSLFLIGLLALRFDFNTETRAFAAMIGIGVGIDYALFIVTRYREGLHAGMAGPDAVVQAIDTAGRSILFAGSIVIVALVGLATMGIPFVAALGLAAAIVVALAVIVALTFLPALLAAIGPHIDRWSIPAFHASASDDERTVWYRLAERVQRAPWLVTGLSLLILIALTIPAFDMRIGSADAGNGPTSLTSRRAYDLLAEGFGPGFNGPLLVVVDTQNGGDTAVVNDLVARLRAVDGVARVSPPSFNPAGDVAIITVIPTTSPQSQETHNLVQTLRQDTVPAALGETNVTASIGGPTASFIDIGDRIANRLPVFFMVVIGVSMLLLLVVFRSLLVPVQAAVMNLLSIGAAYGVLVAVFQWGWFSGLVGIDRTGPIESFLPMMLFAVLFGLSTDYEVFLMSRIHEVWLQTGDNRQAVNRGCASTSRVITAAASIMVVVFLSFTLSDARIVKEFGLGLATAVFIDATVIRLLLVPAVTSLLGRANWYLPGWLGRRLPRIALEMPEPSPVPVAIPVGRERE